jgi:hypothetical protein
MERNEFEYLKWLETEEVITSLLDERDLLKEELEVLYADFITIN